MQMSRRVIIIQTHTQSDMPVVVIDVALGVLDARDLVEFQELDDNGFDLVDFESDFVNQLVVLAEVHTRGIQQVDLEARR